MSGLNSLSTKVEQLSQRLQTLEGSMPPSSFTGAVKTIAQSISQAEKDAQLEGLFGKYQDGLANAGIDPSHESFEDLGKLVSYSVDFVEQNMPSIVDLVDTLIADTSQFKLQTCIKLITLVLPPSIAIAEGIIASLINEIVSIKNKVARISQLPSQPAIVVNDLTKLMMVKQKPGMLSTIRRAFRK